MKNTKYLKLFFVAMLVPSIFAEYINIDKLNYRNELYYAVNSQTPYSGKVVKYYDNLDKEWESIVKDIELNISQVTGQSLINNNDYLDFILDTKTNNILRKEMAELGNITYIGTLKDGKFDGKVMMFFENGQVQFNYFLKNGVNDGDFLEYFSDGQIYKKLFFIDGEVEGLLEEYHPNGQLKSSKKAKNGKWDGTHKGFFPNGQMEYVAEYLDGKANGQIITYYKSGQIENKSLHKNGVTGVRTSFYENGQAHEKFMHEGNSYEAFHKDGSIAAMGTVNESSEIVGDFKVFATNGTLLEHSVRPNGFYKRFHQRWSYRLETNLKDNLLDGEFLFSKCEKSDQCSKKNRGVLTVRENKDGSLDSVAKSCQEFGEKDGRLKWRGSWCSVIDNYLNDDEHIKIRRCLSVLEKRELRNEVMREQAKDDSLDAFLKCPQ